jgi:hypothetical protein
MHPIATGINLSSNALPGLQQMVSGQFGFLPSLDNNPSQKFVQNFFQD